MLLDADLINEHHFMQIVAWNSIRDETERSTTQKMYEDSLRLAMLRSKDEASALEDEERMLIASLPLSSSSPNNLGTICEFDHHPAAPTTISSNIVGRGQDTGDDPLSNRRVQFVVTPPSTSLSSSPSSSSASATMASFVAELELALQVSSQDQAMQHEEEERRRVADEEMLADLSALISDEEEEDRRTRDMEYEAELELAMQQSEQMDTSYYHRVGNVDENKSNDSS
jgi:hypothetical protein